MSRSHFPKVWWTLGTFLVGVLLMGVVSSLGNITMLQGSVLSLLNKVGLTDFKEEYPDYGIENITLLKISNPDENLPFYKYKASSIVRNFGEGSDKADVVISAGSGQKSAFVRNELYGLTLGKGESFIFDDYELLMNKLANYQEFDVAIDMKNIKDRDLANNSRKVYAFEEPLKLQSFEVSAYDFDKHFTFSYQPSAEYAEELSALPMQICVAKDYKWPSGTDLKYAETNTASDVYSYYKVKADPKLFVDDSFECSDARKSSDQYAVFANLDLENEYAVFLKVITGQNSYAVSNIVYLPKQEFLTRASFVKLFVEETGMPLYTDGQNYFEDVKGDESYSPFVQTMFNNGLFRETSDMQFGADNEVLRGEVLEPILSYYDIDLVISDAAPHFADVSQDSKNYFFLEALYSTGETKSLGLHFGPDKRVSKQFLKYLIDGLNQK